MKNKIKSKKAKVSKLGKPYKKTKAIKDGSFTFLTSTTKRDPVKTVGKLKSVKKKTVTPTKSMKKSALKSKRAATTSKLTALGHSPKKAKRLSKRRVKK